MLAKGAPKMKNDFFPTKDDADNRSADKGGPKKANPGSAGEGKKISNGDEPYKQVTKFGGK